MGSGIVQVSAQAGYQVAMRDIEQRFVDGGMNIIRKNLAREVEKGKRTQADMDALLGRIKPTVDMKEAATDADIIVEVIIELLEVKKKVFQELETIVKPECLFFSNTSGVSITAMAAVTKRPDKFIGTHFFNPVPVMKLLEVIKGYETSEEPSRSPWSGARASARKRSSSTRRRPSRSTGSYARCSTKPSSCWARGWPGRGHRQGNGAGLQSPDRPSGAFGSRGSRHAAAHPGEPVPGAGRQVPACADAGKARARGAFRPQERQGRIRLHEEIGVRVSEDKAGYRVSGRKQILLIEIPRYLRPLDPIP